MADSIKIICPSCGLKVDTPRYDTDLPDAVELRGIVCPECDTGGFDMPEYCDAKGRGVSSDPDTFEEQFIKWMNRSMGAGIIVAITSVFMLGLGVLSLAVNFS